MKDSIELNKANWDERAPLHAASKEYACESYVEAGGFIFQAVKVETLRLQAK